MPRRAQSRNWKKQRKIGYLEKKKHKFYIFCEGQQTEPLYFATFRELIEKNPIYKDMVLIEIIPCQSETMRVIHAAEEYMTEHHIMRGQVCCVYDKDSFPAEIAPGTKVHELVVEMAKYLPEDIKKYFIEESF